MPSPESTQKQEPPRILAAHPDTGTLRLIRESVSQILNAAVDTTPTAEYAFELALKRQYCLFLFGTNLPNLDGEILYNFLAKAYPLCHNITRACPAVIYIGEEDDVKKSDELRRDARVKGVLIRPLSIDRIIDTVKDSLPSQNGESTP